MDRAQLEPALRQIVKLLDVVGDAAADAAKGERRADDERKPERPAEIHRFGLAALVPPAYVAALLGKGEAAVCRKIGEEAVEVVTAALGGEGDRRVIEEVADLWFHTMVLLGQRSIPLRDVLEELARRHAAPPASGG